MGCLIPNVSLHLARLTRGPNRDIMRPTRPEESSDNSPVFLLRNLENCKEITKWQDL